MYSHIELYLHSCYNKELFPPTPIILTEAIDLKHYLKLGGTLNAQHIKRREITKYIEEKQPSST